MSVPDRFARRIALVLLGCACAARAEEPARLDDLLVTAALEPLSGHEVAGSVTVITREEIERRQVKFLGDLLRDVPGFAVSQAGGPGAHTQVRVRGAESNQLLVLMDGIRANDPASDDEFQFQYATTEGIERIEIIRGPQSAIWGTDALSGVINIIRRKDVHEPYLSASADYGSFDSLGLGLDGGFSSERMQFSGGMSWLDTSGSNVSRHGSEADGASNATLSGMLEFDASDALQLRLSGQHVEAESEFDGFDFFGTGLPADANQWTEASRTYVNAEARAEPAGAGWNGSLAVNWLDTSNANFVDDSWDSTTAAESLELRLRAGASLGGSADHRINFALDRIETDFSQRGPAPPFDGTGQQHSLDRTGYAAEYVGRPSRDLTWTLNARLDDFSGFEDAATWQLAASQHISPHLRLRGSLGTGSKAPTFIERFGYYPDFFVGNPKLEPERSEGWELGVELGPRNQQVQLGITYFRQRLENEIDGLAFDPEALLFTAINKPWDSHRRGVEAVLDAELADSLSLTAAYTYLDATEATLQGGDSREVRRPRHLASLGATWSFAGDRGQLGLDINANGSQLDNYFPPPFFVPERVELDGFTVVDLAGSWRIDERLELVGRVSNLFDEEYEEMLGFVQPGRAVYAGLRGRWRR